MKTLQQFLISFTLILVGCNPTENTSVDSELAIPREKKTAISLFEFSDSECMNLQKYFTALDQLFPEPLIRTMTTNLSIQSDNPVSHNFLCKLSYSNFIFNDTFRNSMTDFVPLEQTGCATITLKTVGNDQEDYVITKIKPQQIQYVSESGESYIFIWESPQQFKLIHTFKTGDYLCNQSIAVVTVEKIYSWDSDFINNKHITAALISPNYLSLVVEAIDYPIANLYSIGTDPDDISIQYLLPNVLMNIKQQPIKSDYLTCTAP